MQNQGEKHSANSDPQANPSWTPSKSFAKFMSPCMSSLLSLPCCCLCCTLFALAGTGDTLKSLNSRSSCSILSSAAVRGDGGKLSSGVVESTGVVEVTCAGCCRTTPSSTIVSFVFVNSSLCRMTSLASIDGPCEPSSSVLIR